MQESIPVFASGGAGEKMDPRVREDDRGSQMDPRVREDDSGSQMDPRVREDDRGNAPQFLLRPVIPAQSLPSS